MRDTSLSFRLIFFLPPRVPHSRKKNKTDASLERFLSNVFLKKKKNDPWLWRIEMIKVCIYMSFFRIEKSVDEVEMGK